jgi:hypothetical protein
MKHFMASLVCAAWLITLSGCTPFKYSIEYKTYLLNSEPKSLVYKDSLFNFKFQPVPNGLYFNITNLSNVPATVEWDRCYFIEPTGNPSRAFNVDGVSEGSRTHELPTNISIIPPQSSFGRFTTSALNVQAIRECESYFYFYEFSGYSSTTLNTFFNYGRYWPDYTGPVFAPEDSFHKNNIALPAISSYVRKNNNMGIGFCIRIKDTSYDYKFDFKIDKMEIYKVRDTVAPELVFYSVDTSDWAWKKAPLPVPNLVKPENGAIIDSLPVKLQWSKQIGVKFFTLQIAADSLFQSIIRQDTLRIWPLKSVSRLKNNSVYFWRVSTNFIDGTSDWSAPHNFVIKLKNKK